MELRIVKANNGFVIESPSGIVIANGWFGKRGLSNKLRVVLGLKKEANSDIVIKPHHRKGLKPGVKGVSEEHELAKTQELPSFPEEETNEGVDL